MDKHGSPNIQRPGNEIVCRIGFDAMADMPYNTAKEIFIHMERLIEVNVLHEQIYEDLSDMYEIERRTRLGCPNFSGLD